MWFIWLQYEDEGYLSKTPWWHERFGTVSLTHFSYTRWQLRSDQGGTFAMAWVYKFHFDYGPKIGTRHVNSAVAPLERDRG